MDDASAKAPVAAGIADNKKGVRRHERPPFPNCLSPLRRGRSRTCLSSRCRGSGAASRSALLHHLVMTTVVSDDTTMFSGHRLGSDCLGTIGRSFRITGRLLYAAGRSLSGGCRLPCLRCRSLGT